ncbi:hypothetical protein EBZ39_17640 [bacterium]|nr:hypothetical protein [bacterium]
MSIIFPYEPGVCLGGGHEVVSGDGQQLVAVGIHHGGARRAEARYVNDLRQGAETQWCEDGRVSVRCEWKDGKLSGKWEDFYTSGGKKSVSHWKSGELSQDEQCWDEEGNVVPGRTMSLPPYQQGLKQGKLLGEQDFGFVSQLEASGKPIDNPFALGRIRGRSRKMLEEVLEAKRWAAQGGDSSILEMRQGSYDGYMKAVGRYGRE